VRKQFSKAEAQLSLELLYDSMLSHSFFYGTTHVNKTKLNTAILLVRD